MTLKSFKTENEAREYAEKHLKKDWIAIIHSPHVDNIKGDYFLDNSGSMVRSWETVVFAGYGKNALKNQSKI